MVKGRNLSDVESNANRIQSIRPVVEKKGKGLMP